MCVCACVCVCSDLLLHQHAAFVSLVLVRLMDFVPLRLVKTPQSETQTITQLKTQKHPQTADSVHASVSPQHFYCIDLSSGLQPTMIFISN